MTTRISFPKKFPVTCHTKHIKPGSIFFSIKGQKEDGATYVPLAIRQGAGKIVIQENTCVLPQIPDHIEIEIVQNIRQELANYSARATNYAHKKLKIIGITGTKGKTSTAFLLEHILSKAGYNTALISTVHNKIKNKIFSANLTTEQPDYLHQFFNVCLTHNVEYVIMEVAAQALSLHRVTGINFNAAIFTNFSQEHGEFYTNLEKYFQAKCKIFEQLKNNAPVFINSDNKWGKKILEKHLNFLSFGIQYNPDLLIKIIRSKEKLTLKIIDKNTKKNYLINCPALFGNFNSYNIASAIGVANKIGLSMETCTKHVKTFAGTPGRLERYILSNGAQCFIDYAHNPSSYEAILPVLRKMTNDLVVIFGCGGERDRSKRPIMGNIASQIADKVIITTDNPRSEDAQKIILDILAGIKSKNIYKIQQITDRQEAIELACKSSKNGSIIAILGKGPDEYQIIGKNKFAFSEKNIIRAFM